MNTNEHPTLEQLNDYVHGELPEQQDAAVHAHLATCAPCAEAHETEARIGEVLREHARAEERELPPGFAQRIVDAAIASEPHGDPWWQALARLLRPAIAIPAVIALALVAYFVVGGSKQSAVQSATIDAASYLDNHAALATDMPFAEGAMEPTAFASTSSEGSDR
ncbi:MAG TPA: zf-HC2 domain-containing protein [Candidatus Baltobacteraceae bacterium]|nr:zf-HC2 domain-containing protein [Candidatus Baltobacteraceae bacterium]